MKFSKRSGRILVATSFPVGIGLCGTEVAAHVLAKSDLEWMRARFKARRFGRPPGHVGHVADSPECQFCIAFSFRPCRRQIRCQTRSFPPAPNSYITPTPPTPFLSHHQPRCLTLILSTCSTMCRQVTYVGRVESSRNPETDLRPRF